MSLKAAAKAQRTIAELTASRNEAIRQARAEGQSLRAIAEAVGISHTMVAKICATDVE